MLINLLRQMPRPVKWLLKKILYWGRARYCPVCRSWLRRFEPSGAPPRLDARCRVCWSLERHRLLWLFFKRYTNLFDGTRKKVLHIAPHDAIEARLRQVPGLAYVNADLDNPRAMVRMDITNMPFPADSFDIICCSHVLEHIADDRKAMRELGRGLKADGWAAILVPITAETTFEDPTVTDPAERLRLFGQHDHVRRYGQDFPTRLEEEGFNVKQYTASDVVDKESAIALLGVGGEQIFFCKSRSNQRAINV
jgi:SAM-dependent methyltransferase